MIDRERGEPGQHEQGQGRVEGLDSAGAISGRPLADPAGGSAAPRGIHRPDGGYGNLDRRRFEGPREVAPASRMGAMGR